MILCASAALQAAHRALGSGRPRTAVIWLAGIAVTAAVLPAGPASAQSFFESLFGRWGRPAPSANAYADPNSSWSPFGPRAPEAQQSEDGTAYCVRLCDGRYFPIQRHGGVTPARTCSAFCPASQTRIYSGDTIDHAVGPDGKPYRELSTAFSYRERIVPGCTCNGKDAFGLVNTPLEEDATLRPGDIVATNDGLMAVNAGRDGKQSLTPVASYSGISAELRQRLTETRIAPGSPAASVPVRTEANAAAGNGQDRRVQLGSAASSPLPDSATTASTTPSAGNRVGPGEPMSTRCTGRAMPCSTEVSSSSW
jgi:Protein of unknown function (DUF2865)